MINQRVLELNGSEAAAVAADQFRGHGCPIRLRQSPVRAGDLLERALEICAEGQPFVALLAAAGEGTQPAVPRPCDDWSCPASSRPSVWTLSFKEGRWGTGQTDTLPFPLHANDDCPIVLAAYDAQQVYDLNLAAVRMTSLLQRSVIILADEDVLEGARTTVSVLPPEVAADTFTSPSSPSSRKTGTPPRRPSGRSVTNLHRDADLIRIEEILAESARITGRNHALIEQFAGPHQSESICILVGVPVPKIAESTASAGGLSPLVLLPRVLLPFPREELSRLQKDTGRLMFVYGVLPAWLFEYLEGQIHTLPGCDRPPMILSVLALGTASWTKDEPIPSVTDRLFLQMLKLSSGRFVSSPVRRLA